MASVLFVNALQVNFASVLTMEHSGMVKMFKSLEDSGRKGFLEASGSVYEEVFLEFFANAKVLAGKIVSLVGARNIEITKDTFIEVFGLPSEGLTTFLTILKETVIEMRRQFSGSDESFRAPNKKREMKIEFRLLHDIVAKVLCAKAGSFDQVTSEKLDIMIAITVGLRVNWAQILFQVLLNMVKTPKQQSQGFAIQAFAKRRRTQRPQTQQRSAGDGGNYQYDSIPTIPVEGEGTFAGENLDTDSEEHERENHDQDAQMSNVSQFENQGFETQLDSMNPNDEESDSIQDEPERSCANSLDTETNHSERAIVAHSGPGKQVQPNISYPELRLVASIRFRELDWATRCLPRIVPRDNGKKMMEEWVHFRKAVRIKDISSLKSLVKLKAAVGMGRDRGSITTLLREQLKNAVDGLDIKIDVLEQTFSKRMDDSHQHFTKLETTMVRNYADSHQQLVDELAFVKSQLATMVESIKEFGADKNG
ncbi:hypothetical protein F511_32591 [Dorcoceras hygrometricum]|uniref:Uncharacterized protein n=1 Tax=Dorcoceras hygrometricum TaxID=472368 RepID=A0A2Z7C188_9LAMI|nr:hypothetical protein F511_32591 [Dorcoceras hygrometricum]